VNQNLLASIGTREGLEQVRQVRRLKVRVLESVQDESVLVERGEELARQGRQVQPPGLAMDDLKAAGAFTVFRLNHSWCLDRRADRFAQDPKVMAMIVTEALRSAFAIGFSAGLKGCLQVGQPLSNAESVVSGPLSVGEERQRP
jgi:hypothetical protein